MTSLIRWGTSPARDLLGIRDDVDRLFDTLTRDFRPASGEWTTAFTPLVDIEETKDEFVVHADLPGVQAQDVKVTLLGDTLTIRGERRPRNEKNGRNMHRVERLYGTFERSFTLGVPVRSDQIQASVREGVLEVHIPKAEEAKVREIEVRVAAN